jgi:hypothetical protein
LQIVSDGPAYRYFPVRRAVAPNRIDSQTTGIDPELPFGIRPMNGRELRESGLRLKVGVAPSDIGPLFD